MIAVLILIFLLLVAVGVYYALPDPWKKWYWLFLAATCLFGAVKYALENGWVGALFQIAWMLLYLRLWWVQKKAN